MKTTGISCVTKFRLLFFLGHPNADQTLSLTYAKSLTSNLVIYRAHSGLRGSPACVEVLSLDLLISCAGHAASYVLYLTSHVHCSWSPFKCTIKMIPLKLLHFGCIAGHSQNEPKHNWQKPLFQNDSLYNKNRSEFLTKYLHVYCWSSQWVKF